MTRVVGYQRRPLAHVNKRVHGVRDKQRKVVEDSRVAFLVIFFLMAALGVIIQLFRIQVMSQKRYIKKKQKK